MIKFKRILIISGNGMMGNTILKYLSSKPNLDVFYTVRNHKKKLSRTNFFIVGNLEKEKNFRKLTNIIDKNKISLIINCSGITKHKGLFLQKKYSNKINKFVNHKLSKIKKVKLVILSTDCVFDGNKGNYTEISKKFSKDIYGKSKKAGEIKNKKNVLTFRSSGLGHEIFSKRGLLEWFLNTKIKKIYGFTNAFFSGPTCLEIAKIIYKYVLSGRIQYGLYHIGTKKISKFDILSLIKKIYKKKIKIIKNNKYKIDRSLNTSKFKKKTNYLSPNWVNLIKETKKFNEKLIL